MNIKLGDLCKIQAGGTPSRNISKYWENGDIPWVKIGDIESKFLNKTTEFITKEGLNNSSAKMIEKGSILYTIFATLGEVCITNIDVTTNQAIAGLTLRDDKVDLEYLYYFLKSLHLHVNSIGRGVAQNNINLTILREFSVPVPNRKKQLEIANILKVIENIIESRKKQIQEYDQLIKSRFVEMFEGNNYHKLLWNDVFNTKTGKLDSNAMVPDGKYPFFTCAKEIFNIDEYAFDQEALLLAGNNAAGKYDVKHYKGKFNAYQRTYVLSLLKDTWSYRLFQHQLQDKLGYLQEQSKGSNTRYITLKILSELEFIVPPIELQQEFTTFVQQVDKLKLEVQKSLNKTETLYKALMQKYFG